MCTAINTIAVFLLQAAHASSSKLLHVEIPVNKTCQDVYNELYLAHHRRRFPEWSTVINPEMQGCQNVACYVVISAKRERGYVYILTILM